MDKLLLVGVNFADDREQTYSYVALVIEKNPFLYNKY